MFRVAIDGTASAGKGSIAKGVAKALNVAYVDTGAMYRSIALLVQEQGGDCSEVDTVLNVLKYINFDFTWEQEKLTVWLNGRDVTSKIRTEQMGQAASIVSVIPEVRAKLSNIQKSYADSTSLVMDGRDIGTIIIPEAELKVFVNADINERGRRRHLEMLSKDSSISLDEIIEDLKERDHRDKNRSIAPLKQANDALVLDTTSLNIEEGILLVVKWAKQRGFNGIIKN